MVYILYLQLIISKLVTTNLSVIFFKKFAVQKIFFVYLLVIEI